MSIAMYTPSLPSLAQALGAPASEVKLTMTVFLAAFACAQLVWGPLSDRIGRRPALFAGIAVFLAGTALCLFASSIEALIFGRFVQGIGACVGVTMARAVVRDRFDRTEGARALAFIGMAMAAGPALAPAIGGQLQILYGWHSVFAALALFGACVGLAAYMRLDESNRQPDPKATDPIRMLANFAALLQARVYLAYTALAAAFFSGLMAYATGLPFLLIDGFGMSPALYGLIPSATVVGYFTGSALAGRRAGLDPPRKLARRGAWMAMSGAGLLAAVTALGLEHPVTLVAPMIVFMFGFGLALPSALAAAMQPFARMAGAAAALQGFVQMATGALATLGVAAFADGTARSMSATILLAAVVIALAAWAAPPEDKRA
ncbi:MAG: multidrug effflux MFS transporter, partial [Tagaea sp.]|nr:multidrug effflux MFS transporter [Tagaea sp.]